MYCKFCGKRNSTKSRFCIFCGQSLGVEQKMKWFKWLIYFALWMNLIVYLSTGIRFLSGTVYLQQNISAERMYSYFDGLETLDKIYACGMLLCAGVCVIARFKLAAFEESGPKAWYVLIIITAVLSIIYEIGFLNIVDDKAPIAVDQTAVYIRIAGIFIGSALSLWLNYLYFSRRRMRFIN